jgi:anaerobic magnesium-protoporphyrin IX monomethyl ester cyclase
MEKTWFMKIAFVVPKAQKALGANLPINLGYISSYLKSVNNDVDVRLFDGPAGDDPEQMIFEFQPDIVAVTATTPQVVAAYQLADMLRRNRPDILTVIGGSHASILPVEASEHFSVVVIGEGEKAFANIVRSFQNKESISKIIYGESILDLDSLPMPDYSLFKMDYYLSCDYLEKNYGFLGLHGPTVIMVNSRGCNYRCVFCYNSGRTSKVRYRSAKKIMEEILYLHTHYNIDKILFEDDEFLINYRRLNEFKQLIVEQGISTWFRWICQTRTTTLNVSILKMIKDMGCIMAIAGFESGCERTLTYLKAGSVCLSDNYKALKAAEDTGMALGGYFIVGAPTETLVEMKQTQKFIEKSNLVFAAINVLTPYPGTQLWYDCEKLGFVSKKTPYEDLISSIGAKSFIITMLPHKLFANFLVDFERSSRTILLIHKTKKHKLRTFLVTSIRNDFRYMWIHHPYKMLRELYYIWRNRNENKL